MEYTALSAQTLDELKKQVNSLIAQGWKAQGGIAVAHTGTFAAFYQAMVRS